MSYRKGSRIKTQQFETIHNEEPMWLCRTVTGESRKKGEQVFCTVTSELVWGQAITRNGKYGVHGDVFHTLHGPTAKKSIEDLADKLNAEKYPPQKMKLCVADGKALPKDGGPNQMRFGEAPALKLGV